MKIRHNFLVRLIFVCFVFVLAAAASAQPPAQQIAQAKALMDANKFDQALPLLNDVLAKNAGDLDALTQRSRIYILTNKVKEARADADKVLAKQPKNVFALNVRGICKMSDNDLGCDR